MTPIFDLNSFQVIVHFLSYRSNALATRLAATPRPSNFIRRNLASGRTTEITRTSDVLPGSGTIRGSLNDAQIEPDFQVI